jgi:hypothetical protein
VCDGVGGDEVVCVMEWDVTKTGCDEIRVGCSGGCSVLWVGMCGATGRDVV